MITAAIASLVLSSGPIASATASAELPVPFLISATCDAGQVDHAMWQKPGSFKMAVIQGGLASAADDSRELPYGSNRPTPTGLEAIQQDDLAKFELDVQRAYDEGAFDRARELAEKFLNGLPTRDSSPRLAALLELAYSLMRLGADGAALLRSDEALAMARRLYPNGHTVHARALVINGVCLSFNARDADALLRFKEALAMRQSILPDGHPDVATSLTLVAGSLERLGSYSEALIYQEKYLALCEKVYPKNPQKLAHANLSVGMCLAQMYPLSAAVPYLQKSVELSADSDSVDRSDSIQALSALGYCLIEMGRSVEAIQYLQDCKQLIARSFEGNQRLRDEYAAGCLDLIATCFNQVGLSELALPHVEESLRLRRGLFTNDNLDLAMSLDNMAACLRAVGKPADAIKYAKESLELRKRLATVRENGELTIRVNSKGALRDDASLARTLNLLGACMESLDRSDEAREYLEQALDAIKRVYRCDHPEVAEYLHNVGAYHANCHREHLALSYLQQSLEMRQRVYALDHPSVLESLDSVATCLSSLGRRTDALRIRSRWLDLQVSSKRFLSELSNSALVARQFQDAEADIGDFPVHQIQQDYLKIIGLRFFTTRTGQLQQLESLVASDPKLLDLWRKSEAMAKKFEDIAMDPPEDNTVDEIKELRSKAKLDAEAAYARYANAVRERFGHKLQIDPPTLEQVQAKLGTDGAVVDFYLRTDRDKAYYLAVVTLGTGQPHFIEVGSEAAIEAAVRKLQELMNGREGSAEAEANEMFAKLDQLTFRPLDDLLKGKKRVYVVADGVIAQIPLAGLVTGVKVDKSSETGKRTAYRIEDMALRLVPSPLEPGLRPSGASGEGSVIVADIDPNLEVSAAQVKPSAFQFAKPPKPDETKGDGLDENGKWTILNYAEQEIKKLKSTETLRYAQVWRKGAATEEQLSKLKSPRYLIISAHGYFTEKDDPQGDFKKSAMMSQLAKADDSMFRSGLVLSGANHAEELRKQGKYDGLLTAADAARLNLRGTRLVVLSACQSGRGDFSAGMGVLGLRRAFRTAGAQGVVMSLFNVPNQSTAELMALFFKNVKEGSDNAEALRKAQLGMLLDKQMGPFHWAGFVYEGS